MVINNIRYTENITIFAEKANPEIPYISINAITMSNMDHYKYLGVKISFRLDNS